MRLRNLFVILISLASFGCGEGVPSAPSITQYTPIWRQGQVSYWYAVQSDDPSQEWNLPNELAKGRGLVCTDADGYAASVKYRELLQELAKKRCR